MYIGETGRTLEKRLSEHKGAVKRNDTKNGIAVHAWKTALEVKQVETNYTQRRTVEAIHIRKQKVTSNLDCGLALAHTQFLEMPYTEPSLTHTHQVHVVINTKPMLNS